MFSFWIYLWLYYNKITIQNCFLLEYTFYIIIIIIIQI